MQWHWLVTEVHCNEQRVVTLILATLQKNLYLYYIETGVNAVVTQKDGVGHYIQHSTSLSVICFGKRRETYLGNESS